MKAAVLTDFHRLTIQEVSTPVAGDGEVIIRVAFTGICGSDVHLFTGRHPLAKPGMILGHEFSGTIASVGEHCGSLQVGDKVCAHINDSCGQCDACKKGYFNLCRDLKVLGTQAPGTFAEYVKVKASKVVRLPDDADLRVCALAEPLAVGVYAVKRAQLEVADSVLVIGAGPIGLCCALAAQKAGASTVVLSEVNAEKIAFARALGFDVIDSSAEGLEEAAERITGGQGFDRIFETSGAGVATEMVTKVGGIRATAIFVAYAKEGKPIDTWSMMRKEINISSLRVHTQPAYEAAVRMLLSDTDFSCKMKQMITSEYHFSEIQTAFDVCKQGHGECKVMIAIADDMGERT